MLGKVVRRQPLYRYKLSDYHASGWKQTAVRLPVTGPAGHGIRLSDDSLALLRGLRKWCDEHQVRSAYSLPWSYCPTDKAREFQKQNAEFLLQMAQIFPVLKDPSLGADPIIEHYADTGLHLNETGVPLRTDELAGQIKGWQVWTVEELKMLAATP
jgi:hypothetical protein